MADKKGDKSRKKDKGSNRRHPPTSPSEDFGDSKLSDEWSPSPSPGSPLSVCTDDSMGLPARERAYLWGTKRADFDDSEEYEEEEDDGGFDGVDEGGGGGSKKGNNSSGNDDGKGSSGDDSDGGKGGGGRKGSGSDGSGKGSNDSYGDNSGKGGNGSGGDDSGMGGNAGGKAPPTYLVVVCSGNSSTSVTPKNLL